MVLKQQTLAFARPAFSPEELDCVEELKCFERFGDYALELLPKVLPSMWKHYRIDREEDRAKILKAANIGNK